MENQLNISLMDNTIQQSFQTIAISNQTKYQQPAPVLDAAKEHFQYYHKILAIYTLLKFVAAFVIIILRFSLFLDEQPFKNYNNIFDVAYLEIWMYLSCLHSFLSFFYYVKLLRLIDNSIQYERVAEQMGFYIEFYIPNSFTDQQRQHYIQEQVRSQNQEILILQDIFDEQDDQRKSRLRAKEIKKNLLKNNILLNLHGKSCFIAFQFIQLWSIIFYFHSQNILNSNISCQFVSIYCGYLLSIIFIGVYQYIEIYIMILLVIVFFPILLIYSVCQLINKGNKNRKINDSLKESIFSSYDSSDDKECSICMTEFQDQEYIITLPCSSTHKFHSSCIRSWLAVKNICPLCRNEVPISLEDNL